MNIVQDTEEVISRMIVNIVTDDVADVHFTYQVINAALHYVHQSIEEASDRLLILLAIDHFWDKGPGGLPDFWSIRDCKPDDLQQHRWRSHCWEIREQQVKTATTSSGIPEDVTTRNKAREGSDSGFEGTKEERNRVESFEGKKKAMAPFDDSRTDRDFEPWESLHPLMTSPSLTGVKRARTELGLPLPPRLLQGKPPMLEAAFSWPLRPVNLATGSESLPQTVDDVATSSGLVEHHHDTHVLGVIQPPCPTLHWTNPLQGTQLLDEATDEAAS
ncbi:hypothetical protein V8E55_011940 [Tylopilus felleus]